MRIDLENMKQYAVNLHGHGIVCHGIANIMAAAYRMPIEVWGTLEESGEWSESWKTATTRRYREAVHAEEALFDTSDAVLQGLADHFHTDITAAGELGRVGEGFTTWLEPGTLDANGEFRLGVRPGGHLRSGRDPSVAGPAVSAPGNPELNGIYEDGCGEGLNDALAKLMSQYDEMLADAEALARKYRDGGESTDFYTPYLLAAWRTQPDRIEAFGDEVLLGFEAYDKMFDDIKYANENLENIWTGHGGSTFRAHMKKVQGYLGECRNEAKALGQGGKDAADVIKNIRDALAVSGRDGVERVLRRYQELNSLAGQFTTLFTSKADVVANLVDAATGLVNFYISAVADKQADASGVVAADQAALEMPDFDSRTHYERNLPEQVMPVEDDWRTPKTW